MNTVSTRLDDAIRFTAATDVFPRTLAALAGTVAEPGRLSDSVLIIVDAQREYSDGLLPLANVADAISEIGHLLGRARKTGTPVVHVIHRGGGKLFNPESDLFHFIKLIEPVTGESVIEKRMTSSFSGTQLEDVLRRIGRKNLLLVGFMTRRPPILSST